MLPEEVVRGGAGAGVLIEGRQVEVGGVGGRGVVSAHFLFVINTV